MHRAKTIGWMDKCVLVIFPIFIFSNSYKKTYGVKNYANRQNMFVASS
jgi:hypothetical protein